MIKHNLKIRALVYPSEDGTVSKVVVEVWPLPVDDALHNAVAASEVLTLANIIASEAPALH